MSLAYFESMVRGYLGVENAFEFMPSIQPRLKRWVEFQGHRAFRNWYANRLAPPQSWEFVSALAEMRDRLLYDREIYDDGEGYLGEPRQPNFRPSIPAYRNLVVEWAFKTRGVRQEVFIFQVMTDAELQEIADSLTEVTVIAQIGTRHD